MRYEVAIIEDGYCSRMCHFTFGTMSEAVSFAETAALTIDAEYWVRLRRIEPQEVTPDETE